MADQVKSPTAEQGIEFFLCSFVELSGAPKAKVVPATEAEEMKREGQLSPDLPRATSTRVRTTRTL